MAKVSFSSLKLKVKEDIEEIYIGDKKIEVKTYISAEELNDIYSDDKTNSTVLMEKKTDNDGETTYNPAFANEYDFASNRKKVKELFNEERKIKNVLNTFNNNTLVDGYDFNINEYPEYARYNI